MEIKIIKEIIKKQVELFLLESNIELENDKSLRWFIKTINDRPKKDNIELFKSILDKHLSRMNEVLSKFKVVVLNHSINKLKMNLIFNIN